LPEHKYSFKEEKNQFEGGFVATITRRLPLLLSFCKPKKTGLKPVSRLSSLLLR